MLFNNSVHKKIPYNLFLFIRVLFKNGKIPYPCSNPYIVEEVVASLVLGSLGSLRFGFFNKRVTPWYIEVKLKDVNDFGIVMHIWSVYYGDYLLYSKNRKSPC